MEYSSQVDFFNRIYGSKKRTREYDTGRDQFDNELIGLISSYCSGDIIEVGCGNGRTIKKIVAEFPTSRITGIDISRKGIAVCRMKIPSGKFIKADFMQFVPQTLFDTVMCFQTIEHIPDPFAFMKKLVDICEKGGHVILTVPNRLTDTCDQHVNFWDIDEFSSFVSAYAVVIAVTLFNDNQNILAICLKK